MLWFNKEKRKRMEFIQTFRPTSKAQLLQVALWFHKGDIGKAQEMVDYYAKNIDLPDFDPVQPNWMDNSKAAVNGIMGWIKENQDTLAQGYEFIRQIVQNRGALPPVTQETATPLPPIND